MSSYLNDHPGGAEVMMEVAGQDATNMFEDIGHSTDARTEMKKFQIGLLKVTFVFSAAAAAATAFEWISTLTYSSSWGPNLTVVGALTVSSLVCS